MKRDTYRIINRDHGTPWKIGARLLRCTSWNGAGQAVFTTEHGGAAWAHKDEVETTGSIPVISARPERDAYIDACEAQQDALLP